MLQSPASPLHFPKSQQLAREEEGAPGGEENEVRREDQEKINRFSRLHQRQTVLEDQLKGKQVSADSMPLRTELTMRRKIRRTWKKCPWSWSSRMKMSLCRMFD